jgi:acetylornithine deacetylase
MPMMAFEDPLAARLAELVAFDTQNPSGDERPMAEHLARALGELEARRVEPFSVGRHHAVYAAFGDRPRLLLNAHIDTVPANSGYSTPPHTLTARAGRLQGLGAADTKGAIAAILEALAARRRSGGAGALDQLAVLFSGDEEHGATVARAFLASERARSLRRAIVCEPTGCRVGHRHRGIVSAVATASSPGGHSSRVDELPNPLAILARAAVALDDFGRARRSEGPPGFPGLCVNIAVIDGGKAFNVIPTEARLTLSARPGPGVDSLALLAELEGVTRRAGAPAELGWTVGLCNPSFQTRDLAGFGALLGRPLAAPVDLAFWTEAALYAEAGIDAVVFGPGDIAQAHAADEYVTLAQLAEARDVFVAALTGLAAEAGA